MQFADFRQTILSPALQVVLAHWDAVRDDGRLPSWEMLRPSQIAPYLSMVWAYKYDRETGTFTGRLAGQRIAQGVRQNFRGLPMQDAHPSENYPRVLDYMSRIATQPAAYHSNGALFRQGDRVIEGERIILPLAGDGIHCDGLLGASDYHHPHLSPDHGPITLLSGAEDWCLMTPQG